MTNQGRIIAVVAHITMLGWIIALILNFSERSEYARYYIRQTLGINVLGIALGFLHPAFQLITLGLLIHSLIGTINRSYVETPFLGKYFQEWFAGL